MESGKAALPEFGKYRAVREIGRGATSVVYLAEEILGGRAGGGASESDAPDAAGQQGTAGQQGVAGPDGAAAAGGDNAFPDLNWSDDPLSQPARVAIKLVDFTDDGSKLSRRFRKLFATEAAVSQQFDHPNITRVFDWKVEANRAYLVMEHLEGDTLDQFITMDKLLPMHRTVGIIFKVAMALDYAHRRGIVNRDIKPANIMLLKDDEVKVMDFGLALNIKKNINVDSTFINGLGSPSYMSPEQIKGYILNHQTDLYSLGVMFYQLLTGRLPFRAASTAALIYKIVNMDAVPVTQINPDIPELTNKVIAKAMEKDLYSRYHLGADMAKDLSAVRYQILEEDQVVPNEARWKAIRGLPLLGKLDDIDIWELLRLSHWRELPPATVLMREGEPGGAFGFILEGEVEIEAGSRALHKAVRGDMLGVIEWLDSEAATRNVRATTLSRVVYLAINPAAFAFATEELSSEIRRLATDSLLKRMRDVMLLAKRVSPPAIHPAPDSCEVQVAGTDTITPARPVANPLGWGAFAGVDGSTPAVVPAAPAAAQPPAHALAATATARQSTVVAQPMPASAAAAITRIALGGSAGGSAGGGGDGAGGKAGAAAGGTLPAFTLDQKDPSVFTGAPLLPDEDRTVPNPPEVKGLQDPPADTMLTSEIAPQFSATMAFATSEMAPNFMSTTAIDSPPRTAPPAVTRAAPKYDVHSADTTSEMAPNFSATTAFEAPAPLPDAKPDTAPLMPEFDVHQSGMATSEMAAHFAGTIAFGPADFSVLEPLAAPAVRPAAPAAAPPIAPPAPLAVTAQGMPAFDPDKTVLLGAVLPRAAQSAPQSRAASGFDADKTVLLPGNRKPGPASAQKPKAAPVFDPDKTIVLDGGFDVSGSKDQDQGFTEDLYTPDDLMAVPVSMPSATARNRAKAPDDFDKTVEISGGFEAQPPEEDAPLDDLFPPIKF